LQEWQQITPEEKGHWNNSKSARINCIFGATNETGKREKTSAGKKTQTEKQVNRKNKRRAWTYFKIQLK